MCRVPLNVPLSSSVQSIHIHSSRKPGTLHLASASPFVAVVSVTPIRSSCFHTGQTAGTYWLLSLEAAGGVGGRSHRSGGLRLLGSLCGSRHLGVVLSNYDLFVYVQR